MDVLGAAASCLALVQAIKKLGEYGSRLKNAPKEWDRYIFGLDGLVHIYTDVERMSKNVVLNGESLGLVSTCVENLTKLTDDAEDMIKTFRATEDGHKKAKTWLRLGFKRRLHFVIDTQQIKDQFEAVEHAKSSFNLALVITILCQRDDR
ncbi:hypothetical protein B0J13DRAFT_627761 [Dactylonectria estremocensis]|uniref:Uncharacterized protein n=1 Tax=Dactylonectria estremocensis TaxID=1079267 RepID=A0A9P9DZI4_9HYPO|nr:hypothetical protein B0J13DRAFT_627761 [Dactylonectria estremocensis]